LLVFNDHRDLFIKESEKNLFRVPIYYLSMCLVELPFWLIILYVFTPPIVYCGNFNHNPRNLGLFFVIETVSGFAG